MPTSFFAADPRIYIPDGSPVSAALARITRLGIGAHPDDSFDPAVFVLLLVQKLEEDVRRKAGRFDQLLFVD